MLSILMVSDRIYSKREDIIHMKKVLVVAAHPDDEILGVGGTIRRLADEGKMVRAVIIAEGLTSRNATRQETDKKELLELQEDTKKAAKEIGYESIDFCGLPDNRLDTEGLLDIIKLITKYVELYEPDTIFTHNRGDLNIDHRRTCEAVLTSCRPVGKYNVQRIYAFETPSSSEWNYDYSNSFRPNVFFDVSDTFDAKIRGMECYRTESMLYPHPRSSEALKALAQYRGSNVGFQLAEAFALLRETVAR